MTLYPAFQATLDSELQQDLAAIAEGQDKTDGVTVGQPVAAQILSVPQHRRSERYSASVYSGNQPGDSQFTPPNFAPADFTLWPQVTPFALARR
jgi:hypothetical protein